MYGQFVDALWNRLRIVDYVKHHPEVADERVERPLVVLGLPRTGTSLASYLLDQDPLRRSLLTWEAEDSVPPSTPDTLHTDPRCLKKKAELDVLAEGLKAANIPIVHWDEADGPTECMFVQNQDFKAYLWEAFMPNAAYADWLLEADMSERLRLRALGAADVAVAGTGRLVAQDAVARGSHRSAAREFPDARLVWAHRDPFKSTASFLRLNYLSRAVLGAEVDVAEIVPNVLRQLAAHVDRPCANEEAHRRRPILRPALRRPDARPVGVMRSLYDWAGDELTRVDRAGDARLAAANIPRTDSAFSRTRSTAPASPGRTSSRSSTSTCRRSTSNWRGRT